MGLGDFRVQRPLPEQYGGLVYFVSDLVVTLGIAFPQSILLAQENRTSQLVYIF
jgi:hypothetical protein